MTSCLRVAVASLVAAVVGWAFPAAAQQYPSRVVTIVVPYPAGGPTDQLARVIAQRFSEKLGQKFIVENVSGGGTTIGIRRVARASPDGHTLLLHNLQISANVSLYPKTDFDIERDLTPVGFINHNPLVLVGRQSLAPNTLSELIAWMKTARARVAHPGGGSTGHLTTSLFVKEASISVEQIPYRGAAPALQDIAGGHVDLFFGTPQSVLQPVAAGRMKAYAMTSKEKSGLFPNVASMVQEVSPKLEIRYWHALFVQAAAPKPVINKLNTVLQQLMDDPAIVSSWAATGVAPYPKQQRSPEAAKELLRGEIARWGQVIRENGIQSPEE
jgi:tripartite-type tricarboxylate transporter receptor subunit TctC